MATATQAPAEMLVNQSENEFEYLFHQYWQRGFHFALQTVGNREDAMDLAQEAFLQHPPALGSKGLRPAVCTVVLQDSSQPSDRSTHCRETLRQLRELQRVTGELAFVEPEAERMEQVKEKLSVQAPRKAGWSFFLAGVVGWVIYAIYLFVTDPEVPPIEKLVIAAVYIGLFLLFLSVARQRWLELPHDRYRGVKK